MALLELLWFITKEHMRKILLTLLLIPSLAFATDVTIPTVYTTNGTVTSSNLNGNFTAVAQKINGGLDNENADTTNGYRFYEIKSSLPTAGSQGRTVFLTTNNSLNFDSGSAWVTVQTSGILMPSGALFFMASGSCPTGSTDVSATYSNKYVKINSTALTLQGVILTGTTDSHVLTTPEIPAHTHTVAGKSGGAVGTQANFARADTLAGTGDITSSSTGGGGGHTHTISSATTLEPSSVTLKACQVT